ncbi:MAG TPA: polymer-forming cytoskeletal protein [Thermomicrobiales bacterium]|nr:polymer-forming cytoskeletal protein [Thermomicrobiales bacterium]
MSSRATDQGGFRGYVAPSPDDDQQSISVIDQFSNFDGTYQSTRDLRIEGQVKGIIECRGTLHIAQGANVQAKVEAENISIAGELDGEITCRGKLLLLPSGRVKGKINTVSLIIHEGAFYEGELEMQGENGRLPGRTSRRSPIASGTPATSPDRDSSAGAPRSDEAGSSAPAGAPSTFIRRFGGQEQQWEGNRQDEAQDSAES